jgi:hypothetical protein
VVAAKETNAYKDVQLQRTVYLLQLPGGKKMVVDIYTINSSADHQYDLPFQYSGHLIHTSVKYVPNTDKQETLGKKNGYEFLWKEAEATVKDTMAQLTFLNDRTYYSISSLITGPAQVFFTRTGANDPDFNLRHEPAFIIRKKGKAQSFVSVIEIHGNFNPIVEFSTNSYPSIKQIKLLQNDDRYSVAEIMVDNKKLSIAQSNSNVDAKQVHTVQGITWTGPYTVLLDGKKLN